jgi:hypothetical protein
LIRVDPRKSAVELLVFRSRAMSAIAGVPGKPGFGFLGWDHARSRRLPDSAGNPGINRFTCQAR